MNFQIQTHRIRPLQMLFALLAFLLVGCGGGGGGSSSCDLVANASGPAFFKVENNLSSGLSWFLPAFAFGADMKPGECTKMGVPASQFTVELQQCNIGSSSCTSNFGPTKMIVFTVLSGETFTLDVTSSTFN